MIAKLASTLRFSLPALLLAAALGAAPARASNCNSYTYTLTNGQVADANQVQANFNTIMTCANSNLAHNGANSDITSLSGLTTPLPYTEGGTGLSTASANTLPLANGSGYTATALGTLLRGYIAGEQLSNDSTTPNSVLDTTAGSAMDSTNAQMIVLGSTFYGSTAGSWTAGAGSAGSPVDKMGNGLTIANNTWYDDCAAIISGSPDVFYDTAVSGQTPCAQHPPAGTTAVRRLGSFMTNASAQIISFVQDGDLFELATPPLSVFASNPGTVAVLRTLRVPPGVNVQAILQVFVVNGDQTAVYTYISDPGVNDETPSISMTDFGAAEDSAGGGDPAGARYNVRTNTNSQVRTRVSYSSVDVSLNMTTLGWIDTRGRYN